MILDQDVISDAVIERELDLDTRSGQQVEQERFLELLYNLECSISCSNQEEIKDGNWNYIPFSHLSFYKTLRVVTKKLGTDIKFLELGCGLGVKLHIASRWANIKHVDGVEIVPRYAKIAQNMIGDNGKVFCQDVRDFNDFANYDVIYTFGQLKNERADGIIDRKIKERMKPGAVFILACVASGIAFWRKKDTGNDYNSVWQLSWSD